jgi:hypothetical protein
MVSSTVGGGVIRMTLASDSSSSTVCGGVIRTTLGSDSSSSEWLSVFL